MESEDLDLKLCTYHSYAVPSSIFLGYIYRSAVTIASAKIHYTYLNKLRKSCS